MLLLDTSVFSAIMREVPAVRTWIAALAPEQRLVICTVVRGEVLYGLERLPSGRRRDELQAKADALFSMMPCEPLPAEAGDHYAMFKAGQQRRGLSLDDNDLWIAATACALGVVLVTNDRDFQRIENLDTLIP